jgi:hypothetical protein
MCPAVRSGRFDEPHQLPLIKESNESRVQPSETRCAPGMILQERARHDLQPRRERREELASSRWSALVESRPCKVHRQNRGCQMLTPTSPGSRTPGCSARHRCPKNCATHSPSGTMTKTAARAQWMKTAKEIENMRALDWSRSKHFSRLCGFPPVRQQPSSLPRASPWANRMAAVMCSKVPSSMSPPRA